MQANRRDNYICLQPSIVFFFSGHDNSTEGRVDEAVKVVCRDSRMKGNGRCDSSWHASLGTTIAIPRVGVSGQVRTVMSDVLNDT